MSLKNKIKKIIPDKIFLKYLYYKKFNRIINFDKPITFNEKLQWLKLYDRNPEYTKMVDKYEAKKYVASIIGQEYVIPTLGVYENFNEIDFDKLPNQFVIKCTHDSGGVIVCKDKNSLNFNSIKKQINKNLKRNFFLLGREWPYKNVKPRIIIEKYMVDESGKQLKDYKIFNFNGKSKLIQVDYDRFINHRRRFFDENWNEIDIALNYDDNKDFNIDKPQNLDKMIELSERLAENIPFVRSDFYVIYDKIYFGELTFFPESGFGKFLNYKQDVMLGEMLELPKEKRIEK